MNRLLSAVKTLDWWLVVPTVYLISLSFVVQHAILFKTNGAMVAFSLNAHIWAIAGAIAVAIIAAYFNPEKWQRVFWPVFILSIFGLIGLALTQSTDAQRWLDIGGLRFQPTEIIKLACVGVAAGLIHRFAQKSGNWTMLFSSLAVFAVPALLIALQPNLSSALVFFAVWGVMMLASPVKVSSMLIIAFSVLAVLVLAAPLLAPYQQDRITSFINPDQDVQGASYNSIQASIAIGSGGLTGKGLDSGTQSQLNFLPAQHTDFAFAVTAEKLGLIGALTVVVALTFIMVRMTYLAWLTTNLYYRQLLVGITAMFLLHSLVNIGMNVGLLPVTGLPLPFLSYGGTFMFACLLAILLSLIISSHVRNEKVSKKQSLQR